jgi:hypothetical protein
MRLVCCPSRILTDIDAYDAFASIYVALLKFKLCSAGIFYSMNSEMSFTSSATKTLLNPSNSFKGAISE